MENREKDPVDPNPSSTDESDLNGERASRIGRDSDAEFGQDIEDPETHDEPNRRSGNVDDSGMQGATNEH